MIANTCDDRKRRYRAPVARGELPATVDGRLALEALIAPLNFRALITDDSPDEDLPRRLADLVLDGIRGSGVARPVQRPGISA
jgi:hypothetical protein